MRYKIKSLNCYSCGAGLIKKIESKTCKCIYSKNTNLILEDGSTKIIEEIEEKPKANKKEIPFWIYLLIPFCVIFCLKILSSKRKENEKKYINNGKTVAI